MFRPRIGSAMMPRVYDFDFSGDRSLLVVVCTYGGCWPQAAITLPAVVVRPFGHRIGSLIALNVKNEPALPTSAGFGARKPRAKVPRTPNCCSGVHLKLAAGVNDL